MARTAARRSRKREVPVAALAAPPNLEASTLHVDGQDYVVFSFELPELGLPPCLTPAERRVARGVLAGWSNQRIADEQGSSTHTVANQLQSVYMKLGIDGRTALVRLCSRAKRAPISNDKPSKR